MSRVKIEDMKYFKEKLNEDDFKKLREIIHNLIYFGSDFNQFLNSLSKEMTVINMDCLQYKREKNRLRIIESKHSKEQVPFSQLETLKILAELLKQVKTETKTEVCIVRGDPPFENIKVKNLTTNEDFELIGQQVKDWCEFKDTELTKKTSLTSKDVFGL